jgi:hypothetical protein
MGKLLFVVRVDGVRLCLRTAATDGPIVHLPGEISMEIHGGMILTGNAEELMRKSCSSATLSIRNPTWSPGRELGPSR